MVSSRRSIRCETNGQTCGHAATLIRVTLSTTIDCLTTDCSTSNRNSIVLLYLILVQVGEKAAELDALQLIVGDRLTSSLPGADQVRLQLLALPLQRRQ